MTIALAVVSTLLLVLVLPALIGMRRYYRKYRFWRNRAEHFEKVVAPRSPVFPSVEPDWLSARFRTDETGFPGQAMCRILGASAADFRQPGEREQWVIAGLGLDGGTLAALADDGGCCAWLMAANAPLTAAVHHVILPDAERPGEPGSGLWNWSPTDPPVRLTVDHDIPARALDVLVVSISPGYPDFDRWLARSLIWVRPGGTVLWRGWWGAEHPLSRRLDRGLVALADRLRLVHVAGTSLIVGQLPPESLA